MAKLTIVLSGVEPVVNHSIIGFLLSEFLNRKIGKPRFRIDRQNRNPVIIDTFDNDTLVATDWPNEPLVSLSETYRFKVYSFLDPVKCFCINSLGLDEAQCHGCDADKDSITHVTWDDMSTDIREKHSRPRRGSGGHKPATGFMTARELMHVIDHDIFRKMDSNCVARSLYKTISQDNNELAIVSNATYPSDVTLGTEIGYKVIRLLKNNDKHKQEPLYNFPLGEFTTVIDNSKGLNLEGTHKKIKTHFDSWIGQI